MLRKLAILLLTLGAIVDAVGCSLSYAYTKPIEILQRDYWPIQDCRFRLTRVNLQNGGVVALFRREVFPSRHSAVILALFAMLAEVKE